VFPTSSAAKAIFGTNALGYGRIINDIAPTLFGEVYFFEPMEGFDAASHEHKRRQYWVELLRRAHLASAASIVRGTGWIDAATREYDAANLYGWAAACRSLIEAAGDTLHSLSRVPRALADNHHGIRANLEGKGATVFLSQELEDDLIHFTHGRKIVKGTAPDSHIAKQPWEYLKHLESMEIAGVKELYAVRCDIVHPAARSVFTMFAERDDGLVLDRGRQEVTLNGLVRENSKLFSEVLEACFNPPLLTLRVLHKFRLFKQIEALRKYPFKNVPVWREIDAVLRS
jgi:hypothetical protein